MKTIRNILGGLFAAMLALGGVAKADDTRRDTPAKTAPAANPTAKAGKKYTPEELLEVFENLGYTTKTFNDKDGKLSEIEVEYTQGGWTLRTFIQWNADQTVYSFRNLIAKSESKKPLSPELIKEMLKQTGSVFPATLYFTEFEGTQVVILYLDLKNDALTPVLVRQRLTLQFEMAKVAILAREKVEKAAAEAKGQPKGDL